MLEDMVDEGAGSQKVALDQDKIASVLNGDRNFSVACELGVRYPTLRAMLNRGDLNLRIAVSLNFFSFNIPFIYRMYIAHTCRINCVYCLNILVHI